MQVNMATATKVTAAAMSGDSGGGVPSSGHLYRQLQQRLRPLPAQGVELTAADANTEKNGSSGCAANAALDEDNNAQQQREGGGDGSGVLAKSEAQEVFEIDTAQLQLMAATPADGAFSKQLLLCRRFKDCEGILRNFSSLPLFVYATSPSTRATSADGVGVAKEAAAAAAAAVVAVVAADGKNDSYDLALCTTMPRLSSIGSSNGGGAIIDGMECLPLSGGVPHQHTLMPAGASVGGLNGATTTLVNVVGGGGIVSYQHHLNLTHHPPHLLTHHSPYSNNYPLHNSSSHHNIHSDQTKSLQELQHEVGALLEFRDLVIETFPDLKHKMASMSSSASSTVVGSTTASVSGVQALASASLASRREWEPGIRIKRKLSQKEPSAGVSSSATAATTATSSGGTTNSGGGTVPVSGELSSSSLTRSRSNSHSGKKEPKSGENNNGSVVQDSGFSTETSSSKEGHSASSNNGAIIGAITSNRLSCGECDDELLNLLDVIHRKSNRLREEMDHLQIYERQNLRSGQAVALKDDQTAGVAESGAVGLSKSGSGLTPKTFREHVERLNKEDIKQLRKERDRLLDKLAEMEAETLTGRIKAAKMNDQVEELISVKKDLEEQLKLAMVQKLELSSRVQQLQLQQPLQSKSSSSQSDYSSQRNFLSSATTVMSTGSGSSTVDFASHSRRPNTFQPVVVEQRPPQEEHNFAFHRSAGSDSNRQQQSEVLGRLDGIVSTPGARNAKCRVTDTKRFNAILLETNVIELQRHLLTLTVQNQVLMQKLEQASKSKSHIAKRLDKSKDDVEDLRFQLEEKNIELEGTKAQLRVLESRIHASTPCSGATTNSYLHHSQNDYETNRSSASTTLMLSRRGLGSGIECSDLCSGTPSSHMGQMLPPTSAQISTPSMKAMVHLPMDEMQHSSSTESAHEHELEAPQTGINARIMSTSVDGVSPFEQRGQLAVRKFVNGSSATTTKPSKIPLPGSKAVAYFVAASKPPTGRPSTGGRSPPVSTSTANKLALSRSTGNLLYNKSPSSLKRADSSQSIRKENSSSLSTNTSRSSTSSSIPLSTAPHNPATTKAHGAGNTPSSRVLQNSPLPKLKRESLTSRMRHMDSLSRMHQQSNSHLSNVSDTSPLASVTRTSINSGSGSTGNGSYILSSTPKPSTIAAQLNATLRKDLQLGSRRTTASTSPAGTTPAASATRRVSSSATASAPRLAGRHHEQSALNAAEPQQQQQQQQQHHSGPSGGADSDSGKKLAFLYNKSVSKSQPNSDSRDYVSSILRRPTGDHNNAMRLTSEMADFDSDAKLEEAYAEEEEEADFVHQFEPAGPSLLVTFDYGYTDSMEAQISCSPDLESRSVYTIAEESEPSLEIDSGRVVDAADQSIWFCTPPLQDYQRDELAAAFKVHHVQHVLKGSLNSVLSSLPDADMVSNGRVYVYDDTEYETDEEGQFYESIGCI